MGQSKYLASFERLKAEGAGLYMLPGNRLIIEVFEKEELKTSGGIFVGVDQRDHRSTTQENRALVGLVLLSGSGYTDADGETVELDYQPGNVVILSEYGVKYYSEFPGITVTKQTLGMTADSEVSMSFPSIEAFNKAKELLRV